MQTKSKGDPFSRTVNEFHGRGVSERMSTAGYAALIDHYDPLFEVVSDKEFTALVRAAIHELRSPKYISTGYHYQVWYFASAGVRSKSGNGPETCAIPTAGMYASRRNGRRIWSNAHSTTRRGPASASASISFPPATYEFINDLGARGVVVSKKSPSSHKVHLRLLDCSTDETHRHLFSK
jgi:hypothetical protein